MRPAERAASCAGRAGGGARGRVGWAWAWVWGVRSVWCGPQHTGRDARRVLSQAPVPAHVGEATRAPPSRRVPAGPRTRACERSRRTDARERTHLRVRVRARRVEQRRRDGRHRRDARRVRRDEQLEDARGGEAEGDGVVRVLRHADDRLRRGEHRARVAREERDDGDGVRDRVCGAGGAGRAWGRERGARDVGERRGAKRRTARAPRAAAAALPLAVTTHRPACRPRRSAASGGPPRRWRRSPSWTRPYTTCPAPRARPPCTRRSTRPRARAARRRRTRPAPAGR